MVAKMKRKGHSKSNTAQLTVVEVLKRYGLEVDGMATAQAIQL